MVALLNNATHMQPMQIWEGRRKIYT